jgi:DNA-binding protein YbaB
MSSPLHNQIEQRMVQLRERREAMARIQRDLAEARFTVDSKNRAVSVTVDSRGEPVDIKFRTSSYRSMAPAELSQLLLETIKAARDEAKMAAVTAFGPLLPPGTPLADLMSGQLNFEEMMRRAIPMPEDPDPADLARASSRLAAGGTRAAGRQAARDA